MTYVTALGIEMIETCMLRYVYAENDLFPPNMFMFGVVSLESNEDESKSLRLRHRTGTFMIKLGRHDTDWV